MPGTRPENAAVNASGIRAAFLQVPASDTAPPADSAASPPLGSAPPAAWGQWPNGTT